MPSFEGPEVSPSGAGEDVFGFLRGPIAKRATICFCAWTAFALFFVSKQILQYGFWLGGAFVWPLLASWLTQAYTWVLLTPVVLWLGNRLPLERSRRGAHAVAHVILSLFFASVAALTVVFIAPRSGVTPGEFNEPHTFVRLLMYRTGFFQDFLAYWVIVCLQFASNYHLKLRDRERRTAQLEIDEAGLRAQLVEAELKSLRGQLQPELVFNTLDAIAELVRADQDDQAEDLLAALGDLLRCALDDPQTS